jgi:hypothetical protein
MSADWEAATVSAWSSPRTFAIDNEGLEHRAVDLIASNYVDEPRRAWIEVDNVELAASTA